MHTEDKTIIAISGVVICNDCNKAFNNLSLYNNHINEDTCLIFCYKCNKRYKISKYYKHIKSTPHYKNIKKSTLDELYTLFHPQYGDYSH